MSTWMKHLLLLLISFVGLLGLTPQASAKSSLEIRVAVRPTTPYPVSVNATDNVQLVAYLYDPATHKEVGLPNTRWQWWISSVDSHTINGITNEWLDADDVSKLSTVGIQGRFTSAINDSTAQAPILSSSFSEAGYWNVRLKVTAYLHDPNQPLSSPDNVVTPVEVTTQHLPAGLVSITVTSGADKDNVTQDYPNKGDQNWACVKATTGSVIVTVITEPNRVDVWKQLDWGQDGGAAVPGHENQRSYAKSATKKISALPKLDGKGVNPLYVWVIWCDITMKCNDDDVLPDDAGRIPRLQKDGAPPTWPLTLGLGKKLGRIDVDSSDENNKFLYGAAGGKIYIEAKIKPDGAERIILCDSWKMKRKVQIVSYDNGGNYKDGKWVNEPAFNCPIQADNDNAKDDTSRAEFVAINTQVPKQPGKFYNTLLDVDCPIVSTILASDIRHNSETYANFMSYATVAIKNRDQVCSDGLKWYFQGQYDKDVPLTSKRVLLLEIAAGWILQNDIVDNKWSVPKNQLKHINE